MDIVFASGLTDPNAPEVELTLANVKRPVTVIEATIDRKQFRYLTIGSVLETFSSLAARNRYLASKAALWARIEDLTADPRLNGRMMHLRGHTFYGGPPASHLFLGQMYESLRTGRPLRMSEGRQLREYAHVEDVALVHRRLARANLVGIPRMSISVQANRSACPTWRVPYSGRSTASNFSNSARFRRPRVRTWTLDFPARPPGCSDTLALRSKELSHGSPTCSISRPLADTNGRECNALRWVRA